MLEQEASSASSTNGARKRDASAFLPTSFLPPKSHLFTVATIPTRISQSSPQPPVTLAEKMMALLLSMTESHQLSALDGHQVSGNHGFFSAKDRMHTDSNPAALASTSKPISYLYPQPIAPPNEPIINTYAPEVTLGPDWLLEGHVRHSQENLDNFLQYVADQGALKSQTCHGMFRTSSVAWTKWRLTLRPCATNTMVVQSMNMLVEENRRFRETVKELISRLKSSK